MKLAPALVPLEASLWCKTVSQSEISDGINEIEKLLNKGCISRVYRKPHVVNPLTVASNKGSTLRLVLDASHINPHIVRYKHKYEDAKTARQLFEQGDFIFSYDLKSAYHHISISSRHHIFRFQMGRCVL